MKRKILICGLPGSGKTTLARALAPILKAVWFDGDDIRKLTRNLSFDPNTGRAEQALRMRWLCDTVNAAGYIAIASFICPTPLLRDVFNADFTIFCDRVIACPYPDTNRLWVPPADADYTVPPEMTAYWHAHQISLLLDIMSETVLNEKLAMEFQANTGC